MNTSGSGAVRAPAASPALGRGIKRTNLLLFAAVVLPLSIVAAAAMLTWQQTWSQAETELERTAETAAEYIMRLVNAHVLGAQIADQMLAGMSEEDIRAREDVLHQHLAQLLPSVPMARTITVSGGDGTMLLAADVYPVPATAEGDGEWTGLLDAAEANGVHVGRVTPMGETLSFGVGIRRTGGAAAASASGGIVKVSVDPYAVAAGLRAVRHDPDDVLSLIRADGEILVLNREMTEPPPPVPQDSPLRTAAAAGSPKGIYEGQTLGIRAGIPIGQRLLVAYRQVGTLPLYVTVSRPPVAVIRPWLGTGAGLLGVGIPATAALSLLAFHVRRRQRDLAASEAEFRAAFERSAVGSALVEPRSGRIERANLRLAEIAGRAPDDLVGLSLEDLTGPAEPRRDLAGAAMEIRRLDRPDGTHALVQVEVAAIDYDDGHRAPQAIVSVYDMTDILDKEERQTLLAREVDHRAKNVLAVVQSLVRLTKAPDAASYAAAVQGRIATLGRAHELLSLDRWRGANLRRLVSEGLAPFGSENRVQIDGEDILLAANAVQPVSMALYELATNAAKHGALVPPEGRVRFAWWQDAETLHFDWSEEGGAPVSQPKDGGGIGLRVVDGTMRQLGGSAVFRWEAGGLRCEMSVPRKRAVRRSDEAPASIAATRPAQGGAADLCGLRILVAEDEPLVAMELAAVLEEAGSTVLGPAGTLPAALDLLAAADGSVDAAVVDVNLSGDVSFPLAEALAEAGIPWIFMTGYSEIRDYCGAGRWKLVRKPTLPHDLTAAVRALLG